GRASRGGAPEYGSRIARSTSRTSTRSTRGPAESFHAHTLLGSVSFLRSHSISTAVVAPSATQGRFRLRDRESGYGTGRLPFAACRLRTGAANQAVPCACSLGTAIATSASAAVPEIRREPRPGCSLRLAHA